MNTKELQMLGNEYFEEKEQEKIEAGSWDEAMEFYGKWKAEQERKGIERRKKVLFHWINTRTNVPLLSSKNNKVGVDEGLARRVCALHIQGMSLENLEYHCPLVRWESGYCEETELSMEKDEDGIYSILTRTEKEAREKRQMGFERFKPELAMLGDEENPYTYKIGEKFLR